MFPWQVTENKFTYWNENESDLIKTNKIEKSTYQNC